MTMEKKTVGTKIQVTLRGVAFGAISKCDIDLLCERAESSLKRIIIGEFVERLKKNYVESQIVVNRPKFGNEKAFDYKTMIISKESIDRIYQEAIREGK